MQEQSIFPLTAARRKTQVEAFTRLLDIMDDLREKCPWDRKQTINSLRYLTIEETFELSEAIIDQDMEEIKKELGDIILHVTFYSRIASETQDFDIADVLNGLSEKLIRRHPHVYGDVQADDEEAVKENWEKIKLQEKGQKKKSVLAGVPGSLPAMIKAIRIQEKAKGAGFDWEKKEQVWEKVEEEMREFKEEFNVADNDELDMESATDEFGDMLFSLINYSRFVGINPDEALEKTNKKFIKRFQYMEEAAQKAGKSLEDMSLQEMDVYWEEAKKL